MSWIWILWGCLYLGKKNTQFGGHVPHYESLIKGTWQASSEKAHVKLQEVKQQSVVFNRETFGNIFKQSTYLGRKVERCSQTT